MLVVHENDIIYKENIYKMKVGVLFYDKPFYPCLWMDLLTYVGNDNKK